MDECNFSLTEMRAIEHTMELIAHSLCIHGDPQQTDTPLALEASRWAGQACTVLRQQRLPAGSHFFDDDLTKKQLEGRHSLRARKLGLKGAGHQTWWRRDVLHWADHDGFSQPKSSLILIVIVMLSRWCLRVVHVVDLITFVPYPVP